jgi:mannitol/fructose-specific phosphotransferase system IIA component (Ntr-type)
MMLANADPDEQVKTLRKMVDIFDEPDSLKAILAAESAKEIVEIMKSNYEE